MVRGLRQAQQHGALQKYLTLANVRLTKLDADAPFRTATLSYPRVSCVHVITPGATFVWPRDQRSLQRTTIFLIRSGNVRIDSPGTIIQRGPRLFMVPPSVDEVRLTTTGRRSEFISLTAPGSFLDHVRIDHLERSTHRRPPAGLDAIVTSAIALANASGSAQALEGLAEALVRSVIGLLATESDSESGNSIVERSLAIIERDMTNRDLTTAHIAAELRVPVRAVQTAFRNRGSTVHQELRERRSAAARAMKENNPELTYEQIATMVGFGSRATLFRAFKSASGPDDEPLEGTAS